MKVGSLSRASLTDVLIEGTQIDLGQFLKLSRAINTGGEGKSLIQQGAVRVNGEVETRRGRKLNLGDVVRLSGRGIFRVEKRTDDRTNPEPE